MNTHQIARVKRRRATTMDKVRVAEFVRRVAAGEDEVEAFWGIASSPGMGYADYRSGTPRPAEIVLRRKLAALLERAAPDVAAAARNFALVRLAGLSEPAIEALNEAVRGEAGDGHLARSRTDAARVILASLGLGDRSGLTVATQVNLDNSPSLEEWLHADDAASTSRGVRKEHPGPKLPFDGGPQDPR